MKDWFEWNGMRCTDYGIHVSEQPPLTIPEERVTYIDVPGRSGSLTVLEGKDVYKDMTLTAECFVMNLENINDIMRWLRGSGIVKFANRPDGYFIARITNQIPFDKIVRGRDARSFSVNFRCKPFMYIDNVQPITITQSGKYYSREGCVEAEPIIHVYGSGDVSLLIGQHIVELYGLESNSVIASITIDSEMKEAYKVNANGQYIDMNSSMSGDFPIIDADSFAVSWTALSTGSAINKVVIEPNWRTIG